MPVNHETETTNGISLGSAPLNPAYTFATFVVGSGNRMAYAGARGVAEAPFRAYNPLYLYGGVGLGKTHLLHAIAQDTLAQRYTVLYMTSESFTNEFSDARQTRTIEAFRARYRSADVFLVDDIQFLENKGVTEEEFIATFNDLSNLNKQIVVTSDRLPSELKSLAERLRSRFQGGLTADIRLPEYELRKGILHSKPYVTQNGVPAEVVEYISRRVKTNVRELEGAMTTIMGEVRSRGDALTLETTRWAMRGVDPKLMRPLVTSEEILQAICTYYTVTRDDLMGKRRDRTIVVPRQIAMFLMHEDAEVKAEVIGQMLGGRDHTTVLHGINKIERALATGEALRHEVDAIRRALHE